MTTTDWEIITNYTDWVGTSSRTFTFPKVQGSVRVKNQGNANLTYTIGSKTGTLAPNQSVTVNEKISSYTLTASSGVHTFEVFALEDGTEKQEQDNSGDYASLATQLADKAKQTDLSALTTRVTNVESNKRDKSTKITGLDLDISSDGNKLKLVNLSDEVKQAMAGTTPINASVGVSGITNDKVASKVITYDKTTFLKTGKNLFDKSRVTQAYYVDYSTGNLVAQNAQYPTSVSDFTEIEPSTQYALRYAAQVAFYDVNRVYISGVNWVNPFTTPANAKYVRYNMDTPNIDSQQLEKGSAFTSYEPFKLYTDIIKIQKSNFENVVIDKTDLSFKAVELTVGKNKFNKATITAHKYVLYSDGSLQNEVVPYYYSASDYIEVLPSTQYVMSSTEQIAWYDQNKTYISGSNNLKTFTSPANAKYVRISVPTANLDIMQFEPGSTATEYVSFGYIIDQLQVPRQNDDFKLYLPKEICVAKGRTIEVYNKQVCHCGNIDNYHFNWKSSVGIAYDRKYTIDSTNLSVGSYTLTLDVYDNNFNIITSGSTTIKVIAKPSNAAVKTVLPIGDSLTDLDYWRKELKNLADTMFGGTKLNYIGTKGSDPLYKHEGMSGWNTYSFLANNNYTYGGNIILTVSNVTVVPASKKQYTIPDDQGGHVWQFEKAVGNQYYFNRVTNGTYTMSASGTITQADSATGDATITYTSWAWQPGNPFWNTTTNQLDFNDYLTRNNFTQPDYVTVYLGANDVNMGSGTYSSLKSTYATNLSNLKTLIDKILSQWAGTKILVVLTPYYAGQNGLGLTFPNSGNFELQQHLKIYTWTEMVKNQFENYNSNVFVVPIAQTMDSDNVFGRVQKPINPRMTSVTVPMPTEATHPQQEGFWQMADILFGHWLAQE